MQISEKQIEAAVTAMAQQDITFANCDASWQKRTIRAALEAALSAAEPGQTEPYGYAFQHEDTGLEQVVDLQQVEWGFEKNNPRWQKIGPVYLNRPYEVKAAPSVAVKALEWHDRHDIPLRANDLLAESVVGQFAIRPSSTGSSYRLFMPWAHYNDAKVFSSVEEAKAAAQSDYETRIRTALAAQVQDVAGWQLVPKHPTDEMIAAAYVLGEASAEVIDEMWADMLAAAPAKQEGSALKDEVR
jgi:hypothetical protein